METEAPLSTAILTPAFPLPEGPKGWRGSTFALSLLIHGAVVAGLTAASSAGWLDPPRDAFLEHVTAQEHKIVWYTPLADLPTVAPAERPQAAEAAPLQKPQFYPQEIAANHPKPESRRQMILQSPPQLRIEQDVAVPNVLAWSSFTPAAPPPPKPRFEPPVPARAAAQPAVLPEVNAPLVAAAANPALPIVQDQIRRPEPLKKFQVPQRAPKPVAEARILEEAAVVPVAGSSGPALDRIMPSEKIARAKFVVPERTSRTAKSAVGLEPQPAAIVTTNQPNKVIVGLDPAPQTIAPPPPGNRTAEFSGSPSGVEKGTGSPPAVEVARADLRVPNLAIAPAIPRSAPSIEDRAAFRRQLLSLGSNSSRNPAPAAETRVLQGSNVYTMSVDMASITSLAGSWTVRFSELGGSSAEDILTAPVPIRKVDPKYIAAAAAEGVEGKVMLYAVIRRDGRVDQVRLVQGIDERLDMSAVAAFQKWEFQPATKNGSPVDLEAVIQVPFHTGKGKKP